jgi:Mg/Co/Ni transporter MgtE
MSIIFYDHLVFKTDIHNHIDGLGEPDNQKSRAKQLVDDIIHQGVIEFILEKLPPKKHQTFLNILHERPYDPEIINYLKDHISPEIEAEIADRVNKLIKVIKKDLVITTKK